MGDLLENRIKIDDLAIRTGFTKLGWRSSGPFLHQIMITTYGIFRLENLDLEGLTGERAAEFAFIVLPLKIKGATGLTVAPLPGNDGERRSSQEGSPDPSCLARAVGRSRRVRAGHSAVRSRGETIEWREPW
jgi:hypothetical protein